MACLEEFGEFGRMPSLSENNIATELRFAKLHPNKPQDFWVLPLVLLAEVIKVEMFGHNDIMYSKIHNQHNSTTT